MDKGGSQGAVAAQQKVAAQGRSGWTRRRLVTSDDDEPLTSVLSSSGKSSTRQATSGHVSSEHVSSGRDVAKTTPAPRSSRSRATTPNSQSLSADARLSLERQPTMKSLPATRLRGPAPGQEQDVSDDRRTLVQMQRSRWLDAPLTAEPAFDMPAPQTRSPALSEEHMLQLLWCDPDCLRRLRSVPRWRRTLEETADRPASSKTTGKTIEAAMKNERVRVHRLLTYAEGADGQRLRQAVQDAVNDSRQYEPPLMLVDATVGVTFACTQELSTYLSLVQGMTPEPDAELAGILKRGQALAGAGSNHSAITAEVLSDLRRVFAKTHPHLPQGYLAREAEHRLLVERAYAYRKVMGGRFLRADVVLRSGSLKMVGYLPETLTTVLPMEAQLRARMLVEVHPRQDSYEHSGVALKALAVGWVCLRPQL